MVSVAHGCEAHGKVMVDMHDGQSRSWCPLCEQASGR